MKKIGILSAICFLLASFVSFSNAAQKIITFDYNITSKQNGEKELQNINGKIIRELKIINAIVADFPDYVKDSTIYKVTGVTNVEMDTYQIWIESNESFANINIPSVKEMMTNIEVANEEAPLSSPKATESKEEQKGEIPWGIARVDAETAWNTTTQGEGAKVAILDTGATFSHPDLSVNYNGGFNAIKPELPPTDDHGHGTHVAGTIAAIKDDKGVVGVAPNATIYGVKVLDGSGGGSYSSIIAGIEWC
ncbi:MAG: S8 family serine peptidase, partial [Elusimicrobiota bacterium]|nr:S8 family serine peptidase [Elusimicrobiota bacterium]